MTWASGTALTTFMSASRSSILSTPPVRAYGSKVTARNPRLAKRRTTSLMYSCMPQISGITITTGYLPALAGRAR